MTATAISPKIETSWKSALQGEFQQAYFRDLRKFLREEKSTGVGIYPPGPLIFNAFDRCPLDRIKVVVLGQDPYHGPGQAHGLCFSVPEGIPHPPSLVNIFRELHDDLGIDRPQSGNLEKWADQGILLLNTSLTVRAGRAGSHQGRGWERFTDSVIRTVDSKTVGTIFLLWGRPAQAKVDSIDTWKHHVLKAPHPSPLSAHTGFFGCRHFSKTNALLREMGKAPIDWSLA